MTASNPDFQLKLAESENDLLAAQRLRYDVFVDELGADGTAVDHELRLEKDQYDPYYDHLLLLDKNRNANAQVVGVYRLMRPEMAVLAGQYYSEDEYDLSVLRRSGRRLLELGRSCVHADYRGGMAMFELWAGLSDYIALHEIEILFGVASFPGTDSAALAQPLSFLHYRHLAPAELRVKVRAAGLQKMDLVPLADLDRRAAMVATPALIKAYLRLGGFVGQGAWVDHDFNTTDVCLVMDTTRMNARQRDIYARSRGSQ